MRVAALLALVLALSACGGDALALDPVAQAADTTAKTGSEHVEFVGTSTVQGQVIRLQGSGDFQNDPQLGRMTLDFTAGKTKSSISEVMKGWRIWMTSPLFASQLPQGKRWLSLDLQKAGKSAGIDFSTFAAQTPGQSLDQLRASGDVKEVGAETIDGVETTHYTAVLDPKKIPDGAKVQRLTEATYEPVDVWIDADDRVRRMRTAFTAKGAGAGATGSTNVMTMTFSDFGKDVSVDVPPRAETYDATAEAAKTLQNGAN